MRENKLPEELQNILDKNGWTPTSPMTRYSDSEWQESGYATIEMNVYSFDVLLNKIESDLKPILEAQKREIGRAHV